MAKNKDKEKVKVKTHGLTKNEMLERHQRQTNGDGPKMIAANGPEANGYKIDAQEAGMVHVLQGVQQFDQNTGKALDTPAPQKYSVPIFKQMKENQAFAGMVTTILHSPEFAKKELGEAAEGTRVVDTNYAAMQEKYEGLTDAKPKEHWTLAQLETAIEMAEDLQPMLKAAQNPVPAQDASKAPAHTAPSLATPDTTAAVKTTEQLAEEAAKAGDAAAQTNDNVNHGNQVAGRGEEDDTDKGEGESAAAGRRGAAPTQTAAQKKAATKAAAKPAE